MDNKRGQGLSTSAIVLIVLGVLVLVILILGFTMGWSNLAPWISTDNVDSVVNQCTIACSTQSTYDFCSKNITLKADDLPGQREVAYGNCSFFSTNPDFVKYGVDVCNSISCN